MTMNELALVESQELRNIYADRVGVLDQVKIVKFMPDAKHVSIELAADYYETPIQTLRSTIQRHKEELISDGLTVIKGRELREYKLSGCETHDAFHIKSSSVTLISRRAMLRLGMLLRDSEIAKQVRTYLLNTEGHVKLLAGQAEEEKVLLDRYIELAKQAGLPKEDAALVAARALHAKTTIYEEIVNFLIYQKEQRAKMRLKTIKDKEARENHFKRELVRQLIHRAVEDPKSDLEYAKAWHLLSDRVQERTGFSMMQAKGKSKTISYLDIIEEHGWYDMVLDILKNLMKVNIENPSIDDDSL